MRVAVIGAGVSGLVNARVLHGLDHEVVVYEARPDIGGVWSGTRGYPGLRTQNDRDSYAFSEFPMSRDHPEHPQRAHVQSYLAAYAEHHGLGAMLRLRAAVTSARWDAQLSQWRLTVERAEGALEDEADWLIVANGICSSPQRPALPGVEEFATAGGRVMEASSLGDDFSFRGRRVVVLGAGKSGADIAVAAASGGAEHVAVISRTLGWKLPYRVGRIPFQRLVNTRLGEHLLWAPWRTILGRLLRRADRGARTRFAEALERRVRAQQRLDQRGLVPRSSLHAFTHLATAGFFEGVDDGSIGLRLGQRVHALEAEDGTPLVRLDDGTGLPADLLVLATGYDQDVSFFDKHTRGLLLDDDGQLSLLRHTVPQHVPRLAFAGWTNSFRSPIVSEIQALWIAAHLHGLVQPAGRRQQDVHEFQLTHERASSRHRPQFSAGTSILDQDAWIREAGLRLPLRVLLKELLMPIDPKDYAGLHRQLRRRVRDGGVQVGRNAPIRPEVPRPGPSIG